MFVINGAFIFLKTRRITAISHGLILEVALTTLVANWAIQRVVNQQEFHHAFTRFFHGLRISTNIRRRSVPIRTQVFDLQRLRRSVITRTLLSIYNQDCNATANRPYYCIYPNIFHALLRRLHEYRLIGPVIIDAFFDLVAEVTDETLDGPSRRVAKGTNGVTFDLF